MTPESIKTFLRQYVGSLKEETRRAKDVNHYGFDHLIQQLGRAEDWILHRSPSHPPETSEELPQPKKEAEHGVDFAFLTRDQRELIIFVLKDEKLTYKNFDVENFRTDLSRASSPDLKDPALVGVATVRVILAYNKDEDEEGVEEYDNHVAKQGTKVGDTVTLCFERWNLEHLVDEFERKIFSPALLPTNFFRKFTYICLQAEDFSHGSEQWEEVLIPDWREFLSLLLTEPSKRSVWLVAVALAIVKKDTKKEPAFETGWIDLLEWASLALWDAALRSNDKSIWMAVMEIWVTVYVGELERFYREHGPSLGIEDSLSLPMDASFEPAAESYLAFWHLARLGLLWQSAAVLCPTEGQPNRDAFVKEMSKIGDWIIGLQRANAAASRPVMDSHHIELFLVWSVFVSSGRQNEIIKWIDNLSKRLVLRRREAGPLSVLSSENTWDSVFETIIEGKPLTKSYGRTSYLFLMLEEMCLMFNNSTRDQLLDIIHNHLALGVNAKGESLGYDEKVELASWVPPAGWEKLTLTGKLFEQVDQGICITTGNFLHYPNQKEVGIADRLLDFVKQSRERHPLKRENNLPFPVLLLACVKHRVPIPPEFWRSVIFENASKPTTTEKPRRAEGKRAAVATKLHAKSGQTVTGAVILIGSLLWEGERPKLDGPNGKLRKKWRDQRLNKTKPKNVRVKIFYARISASREGQYTMCFGGKKLGTAKVARLKSTIPITVLTEGLRDQANALAQAEGIRNNKNTFNSTSWGLVAIAINPFSKHKDTIRNAWRAQFEPSRQFDPNKFGDGIVDSDGVLLVDLPWTSTALRGVDFSLATPTVPNDLSPTPAKIAKAVKVGSYYDRNREAGIKTGDDAAISSWIRKIAL